MISLIRGSIAAGTLCCSISLGYVVVIVVALVLRPPSASAQLISDSPVTSTAHADQDKPINDEESKESENSVDLNSIDKELFKRLFIQRRKEHLEAVKNLQKINSYERQYKMINVLAEKMFQVIESKKLVLDNFTDSDLNSISFAAPNDAKNDLKDALSSVLENIALFGDVVLNLPDITQRILKSQPKWNSTMRWSFDLLNRTKDWLDKSTLGMINLVLQELNITKREPDYFNPNRKIRPSGSNEARDTKKGSAKKEKRKKGPTMTRVEL